MSSIVFNEDCMAGMARYPDKHFDLAVVDPPYGIENAFSASSRIRKYGQMKTVNEEKPQLGYFEELFRVSKTKLCGVITICQTFFLRQKSLYSGINISL